jgi:hypothetical protein
MSHARAGNCRRACRVATGVTYAQELVPMRPYTLEVGLGVLLDRVTVAAFQNEVRGVAGYSSTYVATCLLPGIFEIFTMSCYRQRRIRFSKNMGVPLI